MAFWGGCQPAAACSGCWDGRNAASSTRTGAGHAATNRQILALANSDTYGGAAARYATATGGNAMSALITPHELGHSLGGLQDEYDYYAAGWPAAPTPAASPTPSTTRC